MRLRKNLVLLSLSFSIFASSCGCGQQQYAQDPPYNYIQSPTGQQMVVVHDNNGSQFLMDYLIFSSLMGRGGYGAVINNYHSYPSRYSTYNSSYSSWKPFRGTTYNRNTYQSYRPSSFRSSGGSTPVFRNTTPSSFRSTSPSPARFTPSTPVRSSSSWRSSGGGSSFRSSSRSSFRSSRH